MKRKADTQGPAGGNAKRAKATATPTQLSLVSKVRKLENAVSHLKRTEELKVQIQTNIGFMTLASGFATVENACNRVTQGIAGNNRIGTKISCHGLYFKANIKTRTAELTDPTVVRVILFIDKSPTTGLATCPVLDLPAYQPNSLLSSASGSISTCNTNWVARNRYQILYDKVITINADTVLDYDPATGNTTAMFPKSVFIKKYINLKDLPITYNGTGGFVTDISSNVIWMWMGQTATPSAVAPTVDYQTRLYFRDA